MDIFGALAKHRWLGKLSLLRLRLLAASAQPAGKLTIIYASQTGNAKGVAEQLKEEADAKGIKADIFAAGDYKGKNLAKETHVIIVASTHGEGEAPDDAIELHEFLPVEKGTETA